MTVPHLLGSILLAATILYLSYIPWSCDLLLAWAVGNLTTLMYTLCRAIDQVSCMRVAITGAVCVFGFDGSDMGGRLVSHVNKPTLSSR